MKKLANHCSDEQLLAFLDAELNPEMTSSVREHLSRCWECRGRMSDIEVRAQQLVRLVGDSSFLGAERVEAAKQQFLAAAADPALSSLRGPGFIPFLPLPLGAWRVMPFAAAAGLVLSVFVAWSLLSPATPDAAQMVSAAVRFEADSLRVPMHQELRVQLLEFSPKRTERNSRLEIWSDAPAKRFAAKWSGERGPLQFAVWQPDARQRFRYDRRLKKAVAVTGTTPQGEQPVAAAIQGSGDFSSVEKRFETWMTTRHWQPLSMARDFSVFVSTEGVLLRSETRRTKQRVFTIITATSTRGDSNVTMTLEVDPETHVAKAEEIRFTSGQREVAVRFIAERNERLAAIPASMKFFQPDVPPKSIAATAVASSAIAAQTLPTASELLNLQANAEYELHRIRACVDDSISVEKEGGAAVRVSGVVDSVRRKEEILLALSQVQSQRWMKVDIKTLDEAAAASHPSSRVIPEQLLPSATSPVKVAIESLPLDRVLLDYFDAHPLPASLTLPATPQGAEAKAPASPKARTVAYSSALVSLSQASYRESWAIRRLAEKFTASELLSGGNARSLETMLRDHSRELEKTLKHLDDALRPIFGNGPAEKAASGEMTAPAWPATAEAVFRKADRTNKALFEMFAAGPGTLSQGGKQDARALMEQLVRDLPELIATAQQAENFDFERTTGKQTAISHQH